MSLITRNLFLNSLGEDLRSSILARSESISLPSRTLLYTPGSPQSNAYFFTSGVATVVTAMPDGSTTEVGILGRESFLGGIRMLGNEIGSAHSMMQIAGHAFKIPMPALRETFCQSEKFRNRALEQLQIHIHTLHQLNACNRLHTTDARLARWLLMVHDRIGTNALYIKQESLAEMLGSRRTTVTVAAALMKKHGWIGYSRGRIHILNRARLEAAACVCYPIMQRFFRSLSGAAIDQNEPAKSIQTTAA